MTESQEQIALFDMIRLHEKRYTLLHWIFHVPNEGYSGPKGQVKGQKRLREGVKAGVPDIYVDVPIGKEIYISEHVKIKLYEYCGLRIEMKVNKNKPSEAQQEWLKHYKKHGYQVAVCYSWVEAWNKIVEYLGYDELKEG